MTALYTSGTIALVNGSPVINGIDTAWKTALIVGGTVHVEAEGNPLPILTDDSAGASEHPITDTQMTAAIKWQGASGTYKYALVRENTYTSQQSANATAVSELLRRLNNPTIAAIAGVQGEQDHLILLTGQSTATIIPRTSLIQGIEADATVETPANLVTYDGEAAGFIVLVSNAGNQRAALYFKKSATAGDWSAPAFLTGEKGDQGNIGPTGITWRGAWNGAAAYSKNDVVQNNKSAWIALRANTNVAPPVLPTIANADWELFARAGVDGTGTGDVVSTSASLDGQMAVADGTTGKQIKFVSAVAAGIPRAGYISPGFNLASNADDLVNDIDFPGGVVASEQASPMLMTHTPVAGMQLDIAWGTGNGGRFDAAVSDGWWHCFIISNGTLVSRGFSKSLNPTTQPNYPAGFTHYRRVGTFARVSGQNWKFWNKGDHFDLMTPVQARSSTAGYGANFLELPVPTGIITQPKFNMQQQQNAAGNIQTGVGSANENVHVVMVTILSQEVANYVSTGGGVFTNLSSQIAFACNIYGGSLFANSLVVTGWIDRRGQL